MGKLIYSMIASLDGYVADADGNFDWAEPDEELHRHFNDLDRSVATHLYGRRMHETMVWWDDPANIEGAPAYIAEYAAIWKSASKVVYSATLPAVTTPSTTLERSFDADAIRALKASSAGDLSIGGPTLAAAALRAGLVDECQLYVAPVVVGGGLRALPEGLRAQLELVDERRFGIGVVLLSYRVTDG